MKYKIVKNKYENGRETYSAYCIEYCPLWISVIVFLLTSRMDKWSQLGEFESIEQAKEAIEKIKNAHKEKDRLNKEYEERTTIVKTKTVFEE